MGVNDAIILERNLREKKEVGNLQPTIKGLSKVELLRMVGNGESDQEGGLKKGMQGRRSVKSRGGAVSPNLMFPKIIKKEARGGRRKNFSAGATFLMYATLCKLPRKGVREGGGTGEGPRGSEGVKLSHPLHTPIRKGFQN